MFLNVWLGIKQKTSETGMLYFTLTHTEYTNYIHALNTYIDSTNGIFQNCPYCKYSVQLLAHIQGHLV